MKIKIITICGSMKFASEMQKIATDLEIKNGWCVIQCVYGVDILNPNQQEIDNIIKLIGRKLTLAMQFMLLM